MQDATQSLFKVNLIPAFDDNYIFILEETETQTCVIIDAGEFHGVDQFLNNKKLTPVALLNTHHHHDHTGANQIIKERYEVPVMAPLEPRQPIKDSQLIRQNQVTIKNFHFEVIQTPGHTLGHVSYLHRDSGSLFCGDVLFVLGCGRIFEGTAEEAFSSLSQLAHLPVEYKVYCAHEYTKKNLEFTHHYGFNNGIAGWSEYAANLSEMKRTVPTTIGEQKLYNPFFNFKFNPSHSLAHQSENESLQEFIRRRNLRNQY